MHKSGDVWHFSDCSTLTEAQANDLADLLESDEVFERFIEVPTSASPTARASRAIALDSE